MIKLKQDKCQFEIKDNVISSSFGLGQVVDIEFVDKTQNPFYVIKSLEKDLKTFVPQQGTKKFRKVSSKEELDVYLDSLGKKIQCQIFLSKKERISHFKEQATNQNMQNTLQTINELYQIEDKGSAEIKILNDLISTLALEMSFVTNVKVDEIKNRIIENLKRSEKEI